MSPRWGGAARGSTGVELAFGMPALRLRLARRQPGDDATLLLGAEARPVRDFRDRSGTALAEMRGGIERADADAGRDRRSLAHFFCGAGGAGVLWAPAGGAGGGSSRSSILVRSAPAL